MKLSRELPPIECPRPQLGVEVLRKIEDERDDRIEFDPERDTPDKDRAAMIADMEAQRDVNWLDFGERAMDLALLFPHRRNELGLDDDAFDGMKEVMESERRDEDWWDFGLRAMNLAVLASETAVIGNDGNLRITKKPRAIGKKVVPLPPIRRVA